MALRENFYETLRDGTVRWIVGDPPFVYEPALKKCLPSCLPGYWSNFGSAIRPPPVLRPDNATCSSIFCKDSVYEKKATGS
jgi:hypothetical protein